MSSFAVEHGPDFPPHATCTLNDSVLQRIATGDRSAVDDCLSRYGGLVWSLVRRWFANNADAEDVAQEIFVDLWQSAQRYNPASGSEAVFITMIARRRMIDRLRRSKSKANVVGVDVESMQDVAIADQDHVELADEAAKAGRCLERLTSQQQKILTMSIHHGATHITISQALNMPLGTVKSFARRGLMQLRDCMQQSVPEVSGGVT